ncbi:hypothetical protein ES705_32279 [subsurface metagenome]
MSEQEGRDLQGWLIPEDVPEPEDILIDLKDIKKIEVGPMPTKAFIDSVKRFGVVHPIVVQRDRTKYTIIDGRRRARAAIIAEHVSISARVYPKKYRPTMVIALNNLQSANPVAELEAIEALIEEGASEKQISEATGLPLSTIRKRLKLQRLNPDLRKGLKKGEIAVSVAEKASDLPEVVQDGLANIFVEEEQLTGETVREARSVVASEAISTIPMEAFEVEEEPWQKQVIERVQETVKLVPIGEGEVKEMFLKIVLKLSEDIGGLVVIDDPQESESDG